MSASELPLPSRVGVDQLPLKLGRDDVAAGSPGKNMNLSSYFPVNYPGGLSCAP